MAVGREEDFDLLAYNGGVVKISTTATGEILASSFNYDKNLREFREREDIRLTSNLPNVNLKLISCRTVVENQTGLRVPCVLTKAMKCRVTGDVESINQQVYLLLLISFERKRFVPVGKFRCTEKLGKGLQICDGPLVCWTHGTRLYYTSSCTQDGVMYINKFLLPRPFSFFSAMVTSGQLVVMGARDARESNTMDTEEAISRSTKKSIWGHEWTVININSMGDQGQDGCNPYLNGTDFVPHAYADIVSCLNVCKSGNNHMDQYTHTENAKNVTIVGTTQGQLLQFTDGQLSKCCPLPFSDLCEINCVLVSQDVLILVKSVTNKCCAVWQKSFEIAKTWETADRILVDDFLCYGSDQILLLSGTSATVNPLQTFTLTDLQLYHISNQNSCSDDGKIRNNDQSSNLCKPIQALESRLKARLASVREAELLQEGKNHVIRKTCQSLLKMTSENKEIDIIGHNSKVCLYSYIQMPGETCGLAASDSGSKVIEVKHSWQHIIEDKWVIGVIVENTSGRKMTDLSLSLVPATDSICQHESTSSSQTSSATLFHDRRFKDAEEADNFQLKKRLKSEVEAEVMFFPGQQKGVVAMTILPQFCHWGQCSCRMILHWSFHVRQDDSVMIDHEEGGGKQFACIGSALLTTADVLAGKFSLEHNTLSLMSVSECGIAQKSLHCLQFSSTLQVVSKFTNLTSLPQVVQGLMGFQAIPGNQGYVCTKGTLNGVRVCLQYIAFNNVLLRLCTRNETQFILAVHALCENLAEDIEIMPACSKKDVKKGIRSSLSKLRSELECTLGRCGDFIKAARGESKDHPIQSREESGSTQMQTVTQMQKTSKRVDVRKRSEKEWEFLLTLSSRRVSGEDYMTAYANDLYLKMQTDGSIQELTVLER